LSEPAAPRPRPKLRRYLVMSLVLLPFTILSDLTLRLQNAQLHERLVDFSDRLGKSVEALDPFLLAKAFYNRLSDNEYGWRPLDWGAPFNLTVARERFHTEHPECPDPRPQELTLDPMHWRLKGIPTPVPWLGLDGQAPDLNHPGSRAWELVNAPAATPTPPPSNLLEDMGTPLIGNDGSAGGSLSLEDLSTPRPGEGAPGHTIWEALILTPTPLPFSQRLGLGRYAPTPMALPWPKVTPDLGISFQAAMPPACSQELSTESETLREHPLGNAKLVQFALGLPDAALHMASEAKKGLDGGLASALPVVLVAVCGLALFFVLIGTNPLLLVLLPLLAGVMVWTLLLPVRIALWLFPHALSAVELVAFVATLPPVLWLLQVAFAVTQTAAVDRAIEKDESKKDESKKDVAKKD